MTFKSMDSDFQSKGTRCSGKLYLPEVTEKPPVVIMAHGFAAEKTFGLEAFAERFLQRGIAAYLFDYRNFGASDGEPRNLVHPFRHNQDWEAAIAHVRGLKEVDGKRIALWGSSFSGGHVIVQASRDRGVAAIVSQVPFVDGLATATYLGMRFAIRATWEGLRDMLTIPTRKAPHYVPVVASPDTFAMMNKPDCEDGYLALVPEGSAWKNECPARAALLATFYRPIAHADRVTCPALIIRAEKDTLIPPSAVKRTAERMEKATMISLPVGHFQVYSGEPFEEVVRLEADFLQKYLQG